MKQKENLNCWTEFRSEEYLFYRSTEGLPLHETQEFKNEEIWLSHDEIWVLSYLEILNEKQLWYTQI